MNLREELTNILDKSNNDEIKLIITKYIVDSVDKNKYPKLQDVAENCSVSKATVVRYSQGLGFDGFQEFISKLKFEDELKYRNFIQEETHMRNNVDESISKFKNQLIDGFRKIDYEKYVIKAAESIMTARKIFLFTSYEFINMSNVIYDYLQSLNIEAVMSKYIRTQFAFTNYIQNEDICIFLVAGVDNDYLVLNYNNITNCPRIVISSKSQINKFDNPEHLIKLEAIESDIMLHDKEIELLYIFKIIYIYIRKYKKNNYFETPKFKF